MACFASSPGKINLTDVCISREESVDFLLYVASSRHQQQLRHSSIEWLHLLTACLAGDPLEQVIHERVQNQHSLVRDARFGMDLLQHYKGADPLEFRHATRVRRQRRPTFVYVAAVRLLPGLSALLCFFSLSSAPGACVTRLGGCRNGGGCGGLGRLGRRRFGGLGSGNGT